MTVGRVYWHFDELADYVRMTNPWGSGDDSKTQSIEPCKKCGELDAHKLDCSLRDVPLQVKPGLNQHRSGFDFGAKAAQSGVQVRPGIDVLTHDQVRAQDAFLADLIDEALQQEEG